MSKQTDNRLNEMIHVDQVIILKYSVESKYNENCLQMPENSNKQFNWEQLIHCGGGSRHAH